MRKDFIVSGLTDFELLVRLDRIVLKERLRQSQFLAHLAEVEKRQLYLKEGFESLYAFVIGRCGFSESSALKRIQVARLARRFPEIYYLIEDGKLSLSAASKIAPYLNGQNKDGLLKEISAQSVREVERVIVAHFPKASVKDRVHQSISPLSVDRVSVHFTADEAFSKKLEHLKSLLSHKYPQGRLADILGDAMDALEKSLEPKRRSVGEAPLWPGAQKSPGGGNSIGGSSIDDSKTNQRIIDTRYIPVRVKDTVRKRDGYRCTYESAMGRRCEATRFLHFDHVMPWALGGSSHSPANVRLLCAAHNRLRASETFRWSGPMELGQVRESLKPGRARGRP